MKRVLFLCSANYYRSRFAEHCFNWLAEAEGLPWQADSRGLLVDQWPDMGEISDHAVQALKARGIPSPERHRSPRQLAREDLVQSDLAVAMKEAEHRAMMREDFPQWADQIEYWHIDDIDCAPPRTAIPVLEEKIRELVARLRASEPVTWDSN